jgi:hypothetical protein
MLHNFLASGLEKVGKQLQVDKRSSMTVSHLSHVLAKLGEPPELVRKKGVQTISSSHGADSLYDNCKFSVHYFCALCHIERIFFFLLILFSKLSVMKTHSNVNTDKIRDRNIFYKSGVSKEKRPVFYLIPRRFRNQDTATDISSLLYYALKVGERREKQKQKIHSTPLSLLHSHCYRLLLPPTISHGCWLSIVRSFQPRMRCLYLGVRSFSNTFRP